MQPRILLILVTYNASEYIGDCFSSLMAVAYPKDRFDILVVDNASTDATVQNIRARWPQVHLLVNSRNVGFAAGNNIGMRYALDHGYDLVYLLNQDTLVDPKFLDEAVAVLQTDSRIAAVQSKLLLHPEKHLINSLGNEIHFLGFAYAGGHRTPDRTLEPREITYPSGAAVLLRSDALRSVGLFNEAFFMYHEDVDLGWRLWLSGFRVMLAPQSVVYHKYEFSRSIKKFYWMERNRYLVILQNYKLSTLVLLAPALLVMEVAMLVYASVNGWLPEKMRVLGHFLSPLVWAQIGKHRRAVQALRKVSDREVTKRFVGTIAFQDVQNPLLKYVVNPVFAIYWALIRRLIVW